jgi:hypothetical protein
MGKTSKKYGRGRPRRRTLRRKPRKQRKRRTRRRGGTDGEKDKMKKRRKLPARPAPLTRRNLELLNQGLPLLGRRLRKLPETPGTVKQYKTPEGLEAKRIGSNKPIQKRINATVDEIYDIDIKLDKHKYGTAPLSSDEVEELEASKEKKEKLFDDLQADLTTYLDRKR